jgi:RNA polymerase sigma factor (sigma-70 family)
MVAAERWVSCVERTRQHRLLESSDDDTLLCWARRGDTSALTELYRRTRPEVLVYAHALCRRHLRSVDLAEDMVAEATRKVLQAIANGVGPTTGFRQYLFTATRSVVFSQSRAVGATVLDEHNEPTVDGPEAAIDRWEVMAALDRLPARWRRILWCTGVQGYQPRELADQLGLSANNVAVLTHRARQALRDALLEAS